MTAAIITGLVMGGAFAAARAIVYASTHHYFSRGLRKRDQNGGQ